MTILIILISNKYTGSGYVSNNYLDKMDNCLFESHVLVELWFFVQVCLKKTKGLKVDPRKQKKFYKSTLSLAKSKSKKLTNNLKSFRNVPLVCHI